MNNLYEEYCKRGAENKLELIDGKLIVGNSLIASRLLLRQILQGWGATSAISLVSIEAFIKALRTTYGITNKYNLNDINHTLNQLEIDIENIEYKEEYLIGGFKSEENDHNSIRQYLMISFFAMAPQFGGKCFGGDFVMRLGNNGFTPDILFFKSKDKNTLYSWYLDGPGEIVMEVIRPGIEYCDRVIKRDYYAAAGVLEYWLVNYPMRDIEFYRLENGVYKRQFIDNDGRYRPISIPGLAFYPDLLWQDKNWHYGAFNKDIFEVELEKKECRTFKAIENNLGWGYLPFSPTIELEPISISFEQYICWSPEAKFEFWGGKPQIGGSKGVRNLLGMLLMTFGLTSAVKVLPPQVWLDALKQRIKEEQSDSDRRKIWSDIARKAAMILKETYGLVKIGLIGDLVNEKPLNFWSEITLILWDVQKSHINEIRELLSKLSQEPRIDFLLAEVGEKTIEEQTAIKEELVFL